MNNTLTAKEWLEKEELCNPKVMGSHPCDDLFQGYDCSTVMEKYANYKNRILEDRIKEFREFMPDHTNETKHLKWVYDKHFNIQNNIKE